MDNQDQHNQASQVDQAKIKTEFSTRRRTFTAVLVLVAALLLGYVMYIMLFPVQPVSVSESVPSQPEVTVDEQAQIEQRLQTFEQEPAAEPSATTSQQLEVFMQSEASAPTPEQLNRLEAFSAEN